MTPAIVVVGYNRPESLKRLLFSLTKAKFDGFTDINLVISIDKSDGDSVVNIARDFDWLFGEKTVLTYDSHLGLKEHIFKCGDLTERYDAVIVLEDDLFVSPCFYLYAEEALKFYEDEERIGGISLYNIRINETATRPFEPLHDGNDIYFLQLPSSSGQAWTKKQWSEFRSWYECNKDFNDGDILTLPFNIAKWPESSWKKCFVGYLLAQKKYFVYPRISLTTNFGDIGTHGNRSTDLVQVPLLMGNMKFRFCSIDDSLAVYDSFMEILPECLSRMNSRLKDYDFEVDLYGTKDLKRIHKDYVLTMKDCSRRDLSFARNMKPHETDIVFNNQGNILSLSKVSHCRENKLRDSSLLASLPYDIPFKLSIKRSLLLLRIFLGDIVRIIKELLSR